MVLVKEKPIAKNIDKRNYGIDLLRLYAMFMVTILHTLGHGGVLNAAVGAKSNMVWLFEIGAYCAVNCYAMISGYVSYSEKEKPYKYSKFATMWLQVVFYSFGITLLWHLLGKATFDANTFKNALMPVSASQYWYFTAYAGLFFVIPWLNRFVRGLTKNQMTRFVIIAFVVFACFTNYCRSKYGDVFKLSNGYSFVWLVIMYLFGAWLKKCNIPEKTKGISAILTIIICMVLTWILKVFSQTNKEFFISYISPTIVLIALCYIIIFDKIKMGRFFKTIIKFLSPAAFGVYLIHEQSIVRGNFIANKFACIAELSLKEIPFAIIASALSIFLICLIIERIRLSLFNLFRINKAVEFVAFKVETLLKKAWLKIYPEKD